MANDWQRRVETPKVDYMHDLKPVIEQALNIESVEGVKMLGGTGASLDETKNDIAQLLETYALAKLSALTLTNLPNRYFTDIRTGLAKHIKRHWEKNHVKFKVDADLKLADAMVGEIDVLLENKNFGLGTPGKAV